MGPLSADAPPPFPCEGCGRILYDDKDGVVVHGNIYAARGQGGLYGDALWTKKNLLPPSGVPRRAYCAHCFLTHLEKWFKR